ncbi:DUF2007 domain-containing protein [Chryseobacterium lacus]|uniref:DUF2007 domain-containing protein n=1 Tax=Chryseobacterium lacus TaxID=2058346 RepID=A0A368MY92_9FLAO|nr:DUF2007 domain-containing protein [Chryseobacterium lacus]RST27388.1 DUF2007 domain-containing protein [Chryseobacterium lacus]
MQLVKPKLADAGIENTVENKYMTFTTTLTANTLKIMVSLEDEKKAFEIIDAWLQKSDNI